MGTGKTKNGVAYDSTELDRIDRRFWREIWESVPAQIAAERGIEWRRFGAIQATVVSDLGRVRMMNLVLGTAEAEQRDLEAAVAWAEERSTPYVSLTPGLPGSAAAEAWLRENGFEPSYAWMKFVRDPHPPRFPEPDGVEVVELGSPDEAPFGTIAALGFGMPAWGAEFFAHLPGRPGWRCYVARIGGEAQACGAMLIAEGIAELGIGATLEEARGRGCQTALLRRRITDAAAAGCRTLLVETGERVPERPAASYRNILKAGFEEAYLRPNWQRPS
ncbi:MAG TPA: GNAT family N-acetyltransferase [Solirubrobacterales bacterium]|jgi:GNAT superfamily N-acetyltransferase|nr:GNAT family N-acetyltransferase [Solirubrobacterales bacterium]